MAKRPGVTNHFFCGPCVH